MLGAFKGAKTTVVPLSDACDITAFSLPVGDQGAAVAGVINEDATPNPTISVTAESGTTLTALKATFTVSEGATVKVDDVEQTSGTSANDFSADVDYVVTAEDGETTKTYTVTVTGA